MLSMKRQTIVFLDRATIAPQVKVSRPNFEHDWVEYDNTSTDEVLSRLSGATIVIVNKVRLTAEVLSQVPSIKLIAVAATGTDCVDKNFCQQNGVAVSNIREYALNTVPEHTFSLLLSLMRNIIAFRADVIDGKWQKAEQFCFFDHQINDLANKRIGIIGEGILGQKVADLAKAFGMKPVFAAHKGSSGLGPLYTPWDETLETSDVISLHCPLTAQTRNMIGINEFRQMKKNPIIINTARGGLVVEDDLEIALKEGLVRGAGIDVTPLEPPPLDSALMRIASMPNVIVTPHVAWASDEAQQALADQLIENIECFERGEPRNLVTGAF